ncbi:MAG TPA: hypothetical protein VK844_02265, partial [Hyphomicrobiales bacterium]|nr:hypothetical protein [Hyphomicrobiales bacterium]
ILTAAEQIQEIAWSLREQGVAAEPCDALDARATDIYTACSFQDLTGQRIGKVIAALNDTEKRLGGLVDAWGLDDIEVRPAGPSEGADASEPKPEPRSSQQEIDRLLIGAPAGPVKSVAETEPDPEVKNTPAAQPADGPAQTTAAGSLELFDRLTADLEASMLPETQVSPARTQAPQEAAGPEIREPEPDPASSGGQDQSFDLDHLSQAHKTALFS